VKAVLKVKWQAHYQGGEVLGGAAPASCLLRHDLRLVQHHFMQVFALYKGTYLIHP
jgi:hypothetical protein